MSLTINIMTCLPLPADEAFIGGLLQLLGGQGLALSGPLVNPFLAQLLTYAFLLAVHLFINIKPNLNTVTIFFSNDHACLLLLVE